MPDAADTQGRPGFQERWLPPSPSAALVPGALLTFSGLWMAADGGPLPMGLAMFTVGLALLLTGAVAQGVAWGIDLQAERRR